MDFEQFKEELASSMKEIMYSKYGMEVEVEARTMEMMIRECTGSEAQQSETFWSFLLILNQMTCVSIIFHV